MNPGRQAYNKLLISLLTPLLGILSWGLCPLSVFPDQKPVKKSLVGLSGWVSFSDEGNISLLDFEKHASRVDRAYFDWCHLGEDGMPEPNAEITPKLKARALKAAREGGCQAWMMVSNWKAGFNSPYDLDRVMMFLGNGDAKKRHIGALVDLAKRDGMEGIQINYQDVGNEGKEFKGFMGDLADACKKNGLLLGLVAYGKNRKSDDSFPNSMDYKGLADKVQEVVQMPQQLGYGHGPQDPPGYVNSRVDTEVVLKYMVKTFTAPKVEVLAPVIGYDWVGVKGEVLTWDRFQEILKAQKLLPSREEYSQELILNYPDGHEVWFGDGKSYEFMADLAKKYKTYGTCLWYFGGEGPDFWKTLDRVDSSPKGTATGPSFVKTAPLKRPRLHNADIFTDKKRGYYFYTRDNDPNNPTDPKFYTPYQNSYRPPLNISPYNQMDPESNVSVIEKEGKFWAEFKLKGMSRSKGSIVVGHLDLSPYMDSGALQFFVRGPKGAASPHVGFTTTPGLTEDDSYPLEDTVRLDTYVELKPEWQLVTIPLADFKERVPYQDEVTGENYHIPFNWNRVFEFNVTNIPVGDDFLEVGVSNIRVIPFYDPHKNVYRQ